MILLDLLKTKNKVFHHAKELSRVESNQSFVACMKELLALSKEASFGTPEFKTENKVIKSCNKDFLIRPLLHYKEEDAFQIGEIKRMLSMYYIRTLRSFFGFIEWQKYKKVYSIDKDFYSDFVKTEKIACEFSLFDRLPFPSFYIDLSHVPIMQTNHYNNIQGILVNRLDEGIVHLSILDKNTLYNPVKMNKKILGKEWDKIDLGNLRFVDVFLQKDNTHAVISKSSVFSDIGCSSMEENVVSTIDFRSPVFAELILFTMQFLMFLSSKNTEDIIEVHNHNHKDRVKGENNGKDCHDIQTWNVGSYYGKKIRLLERKRALYGDEAVFGVKSNRSRPRPYVRCAHWHRYWCGKQNEKELQLRWIEPIFCNGSINDIISSTHESAYDIKRSSGEMIVKAYLDKMHVPYEEEYCVTIDGHQRRYDFLIHLNEKKYLVEFDGEQHFHEVKQFGGIEEFNQRKLADKEKTDFARKNYLPLLRIRFDQKTEIPELMDEFFENPNLNRINPKYSNENYYKVIV